MKMCRSWYLLTIVVLFSVPATAQENAYLNINRCGNPETVKSVVPMEVTEDFLVFVGTVGGIYDDAPSRGTVKVYYPATMYAVHEAWMSAEKSTTGICPAPWVVQDVAEQVIKAARGEKKDVYICVALPANEMTGIASKPDYCQKPVSPRKVPSLR